MFVLHGPQSGSMDYQQTLISVLTVNLMAEWQTLLAVRPSAWI